MIFKFEFNEHEVNLVLKALEELPAKESLKILNKIIAEAQKQINQNKEEVKPDDKSSNPT